MRVRHPVYLGLRFAARAHWRDGSGKLYRSRRCGSLARAGVSGFASMCEAFARSGDASVARRPAMKQFTRILCPVDFSEFSVAALDHAAAIARWYGATVTAAHVFADSTVRVTADPLAGVPFPASDLRDALASDLRARIATLRDSGVSIDAAVLEGDVVSEILGLAETIAADLIVMGTHGRRGYEQWLLGSVTERVLRKAGCPVLTVPRLSPSAAASPAAWTTIVSPVDFSPSSLAAVDNALSLAQQADARLILLHVVEWFLDEAAAAGASPEFGRYYQALQDEARERLRALVPVDARDWCRAEEVIAGGKPYERILETARQAQANLIVIGAQGRSGLGLAVFGSTTQHVVRAATCPVLSVRSPGV